MYNISTTLANQTISKNTVWACLVLLGKVSGNLTQFDKDRMTVNGWAVGVRVVMKRAYKGIEVFKGLSTIISPLKIAMQMMEQTIAKSADLSVIRRSDRIFLVDSRQEIRKKHTVTAHSDGLTCSCMKFQCLQNRMEFEAPQLLKAFGKVQIDGYTMALTEFYDPDTRSFESKVHLQCHHVRAVMREYFDAFTSQEYVWNWKKVISTFNSEQQQSTWVERKQDLAIFPPGDWGEFRRKTG